MTLKELRISKGLSQIDASKLTSIPLRTYKRIENNPNSFKYHSAYKTINEYHIENNKKHSKTPLNNKKIAIAGIGYVGLSLGVLLSQNNEVIMVDILPNKVDLLNKKKSPFKDELIERYLLDKQLNIKATTDDSIYQDRDIVIIATPTDFNIHTNSFDTSSVEEVINRVNKFNKSALVIIKSTIPIGFTDLMNDRYKDLDIIFSPEFLREGKALYDNLYPSRIIIGCNKINKRIKEFASLLESSALNLNKAIYMSSSEAEATKLFSNAYLAMRVAYFNELDSYAMKKNLRSENIIKGMGFDPRIGDYYNNPSFGYGGYCLPKDSAQLSSSFLDIDNNNLIKAIVDSNQSRKEFIVNEIIETAKRKSNKEDITIGIYKLSMTANSDNYRSSASLDIYYLLINKGIKVIIYDNNYPNSEHDLLSFINNSDVIIANRMEKELLPYKDKVFTRDIYQRD